MRASPYGEADLRGPSASGVEGSESRGAALSCERVRQLRGSADHPVLLTGLVPAPGSDARYDVRARPGVNEECGFLLPM